MRILVTNYNLSICKLENKELPIWCQNAEFLNYTITNDEISLVCDSHLVPTNLKNDNNWSAIKIDEILNFSMIGVIAKISDLLAKQQVSIFVISTYNTDYILMKKDSLSLAIQILKDNGFKILP